MPMEWKPEKVARFLLVLAALFILAHIVGKFLEFRLGQSFGLFLFDLSREQSIPRSYSAALLLLCSVLLFVIAVAKKKESTLNFFYWTGLAVCFLYLAFTKSFAVHEDLAKPVRAALHISKLQFYLFVYGAVAIVVPLVYRKFILGLPRRTMLLFVIGGLVFVTGAFGMDLIAAYVGRSIDHQSLVYLGLSTLEEALEMGGTIIFVYALLSYIASERKWSSVRTAVS